MTNLQWVNELATLPEIVGIISKKTLTENNSVIEIYYYDSIDKEFVTKKMPLTYQNQAFFKDLSKPDKMKASELAHAEILYEKEEGHLLQRLYLQEAASSMEAAKDAAMRNDIHFVLGCFIKTVNSWNHIIYALNNHHLKNQEGAAKKAARMKIKPDHYLVRIEQAYTYFASHNPALGFDEFKRLHNEITQILFENR